MVSFYVYLNDFLIDIIEVLFLLKKKHITSFLINEGIEGETNLIYMKLLKHHINTTIQDTVLTQNPLLKTQKDEY